MLTFGNKYSYLILLVVGFVLGFYFCSLFGGCGASGRGLPSVTTIQPDQLKKQVAATQAVYQGRIDSLGAKAKTLQTTLQTTRVALEKAKQKNIALQSQVYDLLDRSPTVVADTARRLTDCDSLEATVKDLIANYNLKDSLYDQTTSNLQEQVSNKDSTLQVQRQQYDSLQLSFTQSVQQQQTLLTENKALQKQVRHQKRAGMLRTIGLAIAAVLAAHYLSR
ncbi:hypothetical protein [Puia dinghuensis]|uniref:Uncharacterized protein n=1 Tax=Puia dinghuensis TaxID=1792502 RepID=A0A8J2XS78_9BACT|nr:hypothetical protein [Puia dinghuensis]GGA89915.1 hypothetical protein GCM10011511_11440 [Puia dinghuensis]